MRYLVLFMLSFAAGPTLAWQFSPDPICTVGQDDGRLAVTVTHDPRTGDYAIRLDRPGGWPDGPVFSIAFSGPRGFMITTQRQVIAGNSLTVTDRSFGNVLKGLETGLDATAMIGDASERFSLSGADEPVARFRACTSAPAV